MKSKHVLYIIVLSFFLVGTGCTTLRWSYNYSIVAENVGTTTLNDFEMSSQKGFWFFAGDVTKGSSAGVGRPQVTPPNDIYTIILTREDSTKVKRVLDLREKISRSFQGWLTFTIDDNNNIGFKIKGFN